MLKYVLLISVSLTSIAPGAAVKPDIALARKLVHEARVLCGDNCDNFAEFGATLAKTDDPEASKMSFAKAWVAAAMLKDGVERRIVLNEIVRLQSEAGQICEAIAAAQSLQIPGEQAMVLSTIALVQAESRETNAALQTVDLISAEETWLRNSILVQIAMRISHHREYLDAIRVLNLIPDDVELVEKILARKVPPEQLSRQEKIILTRIKLKSIGLITVAQDQAESGDLNTALQTVRGIPLKFQRDLGLRRIASAAADSGDLKFALETIKEIQNQEQKEFALERVITKLAQQGKFESARELAETINVPTIKAEALYEMATAQAAQGAVKSTQSLFKKASLLNLSDSAAQNTAAKQIVDAYLQSSRLDLAEDFTSKINDSETLSAAFQAIAVTNRRIMKIGDAERWFIKSRQAAHKIMAPYQKCVRLRDLAMAQMKAGDREGAMLTIKLAVSAAKMIEIGGGTDVIALKDTAMIQRTIGDHDGAFASFKIARSAALCYFEKPYLAELLQSIAFAQAHAGDVNAAIQSARRNNSKRYRSHMLLGIANAILTAKNSVH